MAVQESTVRHAAEAPQLSVKSGRFHRWRKWMWGAAAFVILAIALTLIYNNFSFRRQSRAEFQAQSDQALEKAIAWIAANPVTYHRNPTIMFFVTQIEAMTGDPRLQPVIDQYRQYIFHPRSPVDFVWGRIVDPAAPVPRLTERDLRNMGIDAKWDAYGIAGDRVELTAEERADLYSPNKFHWGTRQHQMLGLTIYRHFNGGTPELDGLISHLAEGVASDAHYDFRMNDGYIQRTTYTLFAGRPDLIRRRWVERILDGQNADGSWNYCWYGWCRGVFEFGFKFNPGHATVQGAWALAMLKYQYPQWAEEHYPR